MQQIITKLPPKIAVRSSTRKSDLQTKEFVLTDLHVDDWLEIENQLEEMAIGCGSTNANPGQNKIKPNSNKSECRRVVQGNKSNHLFIVRFAVGRLNCRIPYKL